jgi:hypothetical protein
MLPHYRHNVALFFKGFRKLDEIKLFEGWNTLFFGLLYALNYGTHVILWGGAVVSWSRFSYENRKTYKMARWVDWLLNAVDDDHGKEAGKALWGSVPTPSAEARIVRAFWIVLTVAILAWAYMRWLRD